MALRAVWLAYEGRATQWIGRRWKGAIRKSEGLPGHMKIVGMLTP